MVLECSMGESDEKSMEESDSNSGNAASEPASQPALETGTVAISDNSPLKRKRTQDEEDIDPVRFHRSIHVLTLTISPSRIWGIHMFVNFMVTYVLSLSDPSSESQVDLPKQTPKWFCFGHRSHSPCSFLATNRGFNLDLIFRRRK